MKHFKTLAVLSLASLVVCAPRATARAEGHHQSGIAGQVVWAMWSPDMMTPVQCFVGIVSDSGKTTVVVETDASGSFRVPLEPGTYLLTPFLPQPSPAVLTGPTQRLRVDRKDYTEIVVPLSGFDIWG